MSAANSDRITNYRNGVRSLLDALDALRNQKKEIDALGGAAALLPQPEFEGDNAAILTGDFTNAVVSVAAIDDFVTANFHTTNLYRLR